MGALSYMRLTERKFKATQLIREYLLSDADMQRLVGDRITPCRAEQDRGDYIVITRGAFTKQETKQGYYDPIVSVLIEVFSSSYSRGLEIGSLIERLMEARYNASVNTPEAPDPFLPRFVGAVELYSEGKYIQALEYQI